MLSTIITFTILLFLSGFFSSAEIVMMSLSKLDVGQLVNAGRRNAKLLSKLKTDPHRLLETILIGNNLVNIGAAAIATALAIQLFGNVGVGLATGVTTFLVLLFGEIIPKSLGVNYKKSIALAISPVVYALQQVLTPIIFIVDTIARLFTSLFGEPEREEITEEAIKQVVLASEQDGNLKKKEREMIQNVLRFDDTNVGEIMTPRLDTFTLEWHQHVTEVLDYVLEEGYSRIPVYDRKSDDVKGIVLVKDLLRALHEGKGTAMLKEYTQEVHFVPENKKLDALIKEFQKRKSPFAVVVDEHGLFIGIVTIEDALEELVGEIYDEEDKLDQAITKKNDGWIVQGKTLIEELNEKHSFTLPENDDYDTIAGLLTNHFGRIPNAGEEAVINDYELVVDRIRNHRIITVLVKKRSTKEQC